MHKSMLLNERRGGEGRVDDGEAGGRETQAREQPRSDIEDKTDLREKRGC